MKLRDAITSIGYDSSVGIWAEVPFTPDSEARIGQHCFENGGLLDKKEWFANGDTCNEYLQTQTEGIDEEDCIQWAYSEAAESLIDEIEANRM